MYGKKYVACGDSFTEGDFTGIASGEVYKFQDGLYKGKNMVYPFFIGRNNHMEVINEAICGTTITHRDGLTHGFSDTRYQNIPLDADYITLHFGINDAGYNLPLGTITDETNATFYGAWNIVLRYLISNYPTAKIGIIIPYGCQVADYVNAVRECAEKWGIGYLDLMADNSLPYVMRAYGKSNVCEEAETIRTNQWKVSASNLHPNVKAHEHISTIVQSWMKTL